MALTENEKKILGIMTDEGKLRGVLRESVADDDNAAREQITIYKVQKIAAINQQIAQLDNSKAFLITQKTLLESI